MTAAKLLLIPAIAVIAGGCAYSASGQSYPRHDTRVAYDVEYGEVLSVRGVAGAVAGAAIERKVTAEEGLEITVRLDGDTTIAVVQAADVRFVPGERVRVLFGPYDEARVIPWYGEHPSARASR